MICLSGDVSNEIKYVSVTSFLLGRSGKCPQKGACIKHGIEYFITKSGYFSFFETDDCRFVEAGNIADKLRRQVLKNHRERVQLAGNAL